MIGSKARWLLSSSETSTGVVFGPFFSVAIRPVFESSFGSIFGSILERSKTAPRPPKTAPRATQERPTAPQERPKTDQDRDNQKEPQKAKKSTRTHTHAASKKIRQPPMGGAHGTFPPPEPPPLLYYNPPDPPYNVHRLKSQDCTRPPQDRPSREAPPRLRPS